MDVTALSREDLVSETLAPLPPTFAAVPPRVSDADSSAPPSLESLLARRLSVAPELLLRDLREQMHSGSAAASSRWRCRGSGSGREAGNSGRPLRGNGVTRPTLLANIWRTSRSRSPSARSSASRSAAVHFLRCSASFISAGTLSAGAGRHVIAARVRRNMLCAT